MNKQFGKMGRRVAFWLAIGLIGILGGCREAVELSAVESFLAEYRELPEADLETAMRKVAAEDSLHAQYAYYELGNIFFDRSQQRTDPPGADSTTGTNALLDSALVYLEIAAGLDSTFSEPLVNMGRIWDDLSDGRTPQARRAMKSATDLYSRAIAINPTDEKARCNLGSLYFEKRQHAQAIEQYRAVLEYDPDSALAHYHLAIMFAEAKLYEEALVEWEAAAKADKNGQIGDESRNNIRVINDLLSSEIPANIVGDSGS